MSQYVSLKVQASAHVSTINAESIAFSGDYCEKFYMRSDLRSWREISFFGQ